MADRWARTLAVGALALAALAVLLVVRGATAGGDAAPPAPAAVVPCREAQLDELEGRVTCATPSARLVIAGEGTPVVVGETDARVLRASLEGRVAQVRLRLRPPGRLRRARVAEGQVYLNVDGRRFEHQPVFGGRGDERTATMSLRFRLPRKLARQVRRGDARADLGIVPFEHVGDETPPRLGVVRLELAS